jgi:hypothetical protein
MRDRHPVPTRAGTPDQQTDSLRHLDAEVAQRVLGYQWVEWKHALLAGGPLDRAGRFLAAPDSPLAHLRHAADPAIPLAPDPYVEVPHFSTNLDAAWGAAVRCGLFASAEAHLSLAADGDWIVRFRHNPGPESVSAPSAALALCRAALAVAQERNRRDPASAGAHP